MLSNNLRKQDKDEITATGISGLKECLQKSKDVVERSFLVLSKDNEPLCIFGITLLKTDYGRGIWLLGSNKLLQYKCEFLRCSRIVVSNWVSQYGKLYNFVDCRNTQSIRWLKSLGAVFYEPVEFGVNREKFMLFMIGDDKNV